MVVLQATEWVFDVRAVSEKRRDDRGRLVVDVVHEVAYYAGRTAEPTTLNAEIVFVERPREALEGYGV
ncbi:hypothetical protein [Jannaschia sp. R86511]|uniref:hypothetical protein n=1 Tax=Jannaschia sp. R86511 TaxID=3093853 RepID=UPI0036D230F9